MILLLSLINAAAEIYVYVLILRAFLSWIMPNGDNYFFYLLWRFTEPFLQKIRAYLPVSGLGIDLSPIIAIILIKVVVQQFLISLLIRLFV